MDSNKKGEKKMHAISEKTGHQVRLREDTFEDIDSYVISNEILFKELKYEMVILANYTWTNFSYAFSTFLFFSFFTISRYASYIYLSGG